MLDPGRKTTTTSIANVWEQNRRGNDKTVSSTWEVTATRKVQQGTPVFKRQQQTNEKMGTRNMNSAVTQRLFAWKENGGVGE